MEPKMKPCPFCGLEFIETGSLWTPLMTGENGRYFVTCMRCMAKGPRFESEKEALRLWNQRASIAADNQVGDSGETG